MHLAITNLVMDRYHVNDPMRFLIGSLLPDAAVCGNSHWRISCSDGRRQTFDLAGFRSEYENELKTDDLIRGYYLHLVQDMLMREYLRSHAGWKPGRRFSRKIHRDYTRLNRMLTETYGLAEIVQRLAETTDVPGTVRTTELADASDNTHLTAKTVNAPQTVRMSYVRGAKALPDEKIAFDEKTLLDSLRQDIQTEGTPKAGYFTEERAQEYIMYAADCCAEELNALDRGWSSLPDDFVTWEWVKPYLWIRIIKKIRRTLRGEKW